MTRASGVPTGRDCPVVTAAQESGKGHSEQTATDTGYGVIGYCGSWASRRVVRGRPPDHLRGVRTMRRLLLGVFLLLGAIGRPGPGRPTTSPRPPRTSASPRGGRSWSHYFRVHEHHATNGHARPAAGVVRVRLGERPEEPARPGRIDRRARPDGHPPHPAGRTSSSRSPCTSRSSSPTLRGGRPAGPGDRPGRPGHVPGHPGVRHRAEGAGREGHAPR